MSHELHPIMEKALAPFINITDKEDKLDRTEEIKVIFDCCLENSVVWRHIEFAPDFPYDVKITELLYELAEETNKYIRHIESLQPSEPHLGCATTKELLDEIRARVEVV